MPFAEAYRTATAATPVYNFPTVRFESPTNEESQLQACDRKRLVSRSYGGCFPE